MGLLDITSTVLTVVKADTSQAKSAIKDLQGEEKKLAQGRLEATEAGNKDIESHIAGLAKAGAAIGAVIGTVAALKSAWTEYVEYARLSTAAGTVSIIGLQSASHGLKTEMELLGDAAAYSHGQFKMTQSQMEAVEGAEYALVKQGKDAAEVHNALTHAVVGLQVDGLAPLGLHIDKTGLSMDKASDRAKIHSALMEELARTSREAAGGQDAAGEGITRASVSISDSFSKVKRAIGELVDSMAPLFELLAKNLATTVELLGQVAQGAMGGGQMANMGPSVSTMLKTRSLVVGGRNFTPEEYLNFQAQKDREAYVNAVFTPFNDQLQKMGAQFNEANYSGAHRLWDAGIERVFDTVYKAGARRLFGIDEWNQFKQQHATPVSDPSTNIWSGSFKGVSPETHIDNLADAIKYLADAIPGWIKPDEPRPMTSDEEKAWGYERDPLGDAANAIKSKVDLMSAPTRYAAFQKGKTGSFLEKTFGKVGEFDVYAKGFEMLTGAVQASFAAWIDGSMSAGAAFKKYIGEAMKATATQMLGESIKNAAWALGSLAAGDIKGASVYSAAALKFAAGAAIVGGLAHEMGGGSPKGAGAGGGGASAPQSYGSGSSSSGPTGNTYIIGDSWGDNTPRKLAAQTKKRIEAAYGGYGGVHE